MAKNKAKTDLPTIDEVEVGGVEQVRGYDMAAEVAKVAAEVSFVKVERKTVSVPLARIEFGYLKRRIDLRKLTRGQSQALRQLQEALDAGGVKLANGSSIGCEANAIKWLLESLAG
jgi:hypothetical protein